jgi:hypothetical protein
MTGADGTLRVADVFERRAPLSGREVTVAGILVVTGTGAAWLVDEEDHLRRPERGLVVSHDGLVERCLHHVPVYVGGPSLLRDSAIVRGTLREPTESDTGTRSPPVLTALTELSVERLGVVYRVPV